MQFKFFNNTEDEDVDGPMELIFNDQQNMTHHFNIPTGNTTNVYLRDIRDRNSIPEGEWYDILRTQRNRLIEEMWRNGNIIHEIISQDENGYTLETRIIL